MKRKVGKLPNKRHKLYAKAVEVLLNWNLERFEALEEDEALPQLEYIAFFMCKQGIQRIGRDDLLDLLDRFRLDHPNLRAVKKRSPEKFLSLLEARSSILIQCGSIWEKRRKRKTGVGIPPFDLSGISIGPSLDRRLLSVPGQKAFP